MSDYHLGMLIVVVMSYLFGSIPTAYLVARTKGIDIFAVGSGNMGATNVARALGTKWGLAVLLFDIFKGVLAIFISQQLMPGSKAAATTISAIAVTIGHNWSLFATLLTGTLRGGKGAAVAFGTLLMIAPIQVLVGMALVFGLVIARTRYVSLAVLATFALSTAWLVVLVLQRQLPNEFFYYSIILAVMLVIRFRDNIQRLLTGTERRFGERV